MKIIFEGKVVTKKEWVIFALMVALIVGASLLVSFYFLV